MKIDITYPPAEKSGQWRRSMLAAVKWPMLAAAVICPIVNYFVGGKAWSVIVLVGLFAAWRFIFSIDLVEYNRISQIIKILTFACIILGLVDILLVPGWALFVVPIVCTVGLGVAALLFFSDLEKQEHNAFPFLLLIFYALAGSVVGLHYKHGDGRWTLMLMGAVAAGLLVLCIVIMGSGFFRELRRRFHLR